jgi:hypothetical protein
MGVAHHPGEEHDACIGSRDGCEHSLEEQSSSGLGEQVRLVDHEHRVPLKHRGWVVAEQVAESFGGHHLHRAVGWLSDEVEELLDGDVAEVSEVGAQALLDDPHPATQRLTQGGRAPYGYVVVDGGRHPNPRKAAEGYRLRVLAVDEPAAEVVRRIVAEYLSGKGDRAIANGLNRDGIPCPSAWRPEQNRHRLADGWQGSSVRVILENPRYTGYAFFGRWTRQETLFDPDDVSAGHVVRFRRAAPDRVVRSRTPAHPAILSVEDFTQAQLLRRSRAAGGMRGRAKLERTRTRGTRPYVLRGRVRCGICTRRLQGAVIRKEEVYYRCMARTLAPGSAALAEHPRTVNLREFDILELVNRWLGDLFKPKNVDRTVAALVASQGQDRAAAGVETIKKRHSDAEARLRRLQAAIEAGVDPAALVEAINEAQAQRAAARAELDGAAPPTAVSEAEVYAMVDALGDVGSTLKYSKQEALERLYDRLNLELFYEPKGRTVLASVTPRVVHVCVRGATCTLTTRLTLPS